MFNDVVGMIGGRSRDNQNKTRAGPINKSVLNAVLDFAEESKRFTLRAPERPQNRAGGRGFNAGLHEAKPSFTCNLVTGEVGVNEYNNSTCSLS